MGKIIKSTADVEEGLALLMQRDPRLRHIAEKAGPLPLRLRDPGFAGLAHIIVSQVVSRASAEAIWRRMEAEIGEVTALSYLARSNPETPGYGLSRAKARTLHAVAGVIVSGGLDLAALSTMDEVDAYDRLTALNGIGPWTAQVYLMFCVGHADIFPSGDVALQAAVGQAFDLGARPDDRKLRELALGWSPWRSVAARLFWAYYAAMTHREAAPLA